MLALHMLSLVGMGVAAPPLQQLSPGSQPSLSPWGGVAQPSALPSQPQDSSISLKADAKPKKECQSLSDLVNDEWCNTSCNGRVQNCPEEMCMCVDPGEVPGAAPAEPAEPQCEGTMCVDGADEDGYGGIPDTPGAVAPPEPQGTKYECKDMKEITPDQLQCIYPMLGREMAELYATSASDRMGELLSTSCGWAAFLGNAAVESKELTIWKEIKVSA